MIAQHQMMVDSAVAVGPRPGESVLSIRQPWAWMVTKGYKPFENRSKPTNHRGLLWIHVSATDNLESDWEDQAVNTCAIPEKMIPKAKDFIYGAIVAAVYLADCWPIDEIPPWVTGNVHAMGENVYWFSAVAELPKHIPYKGAVGFMRYNPSNVRS